MDSTGVECDLARIFGDLSQSKKLSRIKSPLHRHSLCLFSKAYAYGRIQLNYSDVEGLIPIQTGCIPSKSQQSGIHSDPIFF